MVQKSGKHGIVSGHTFRAHNAVNHRRNRKYGVIIWRDLMFKEEPAYDTTLQLLQSWMPPCQDLPYSVNKRRRWQIPKLIATHLAHDVAIEKMEGIGNRWDIEEKGADTCTTCNRNTKGNCAIEVHNDKCSINQRTNNGAKASDYIENRCRSNIASDNSNSHTNGAKVSSGNDSNFTNSESSKIHCQLIVRNKLVKNNTCRCIYKWTQTARVESEDFGISEIKMKQKSQGYCQADNILKSPALFSRKTRRKYLFRDFGMPFRYKKSSSEQDNTVRIEYLEAASKPTTQYQLKSRILGWDNRKYCHCANYIRRPWHRYGYNFRRCEYRFRHRRKFFDSDVIVMPKYGKGQMSRSYSKSPRSYSSEQTEVEFYDFIQFPWTRKKITLLDFMPGIH